VLKFLANENIPVASVQHLRSIGFDITSIGEIAPGIADTEVIDIAIKEERIIITYDSDYGQLIFKFGYKPEAGVIFLRLQPEHPLHTSDIIEKLILSEKVSFKNALTVIDKNSIRQKSY